MAAAKWACTGVFAIVFFVGLAASLVLAKKPPKDPPPPAPPPIRYVIEWLPENFGTEPRDAEFIYGELVVVGTDTDWDINDRAFVYTEVDGMIDLTTLVELVLASYDITLDGITLTSAGCINDLGQIAGIYVKHDEEGTFVEEGIYVWDSYAVTPALHTQPLPDVDWVFDISDGALGLALPWDGTVVGHVNGSDGSWGFVWQPGQVFASLPIPIDPTGDASGINRHGEVVGRMPAPSHGNVIYRYTLPVNPLDPVDNGVLEILSDTSNKGQTGYRITLGYLNFNDRIDVNDHGIVVGNVEARRLFVPALYDGVWKELTLEESGYPVAMNNGDRVCGITPVKGRDNPDTGFVYHPQDGYWSLNDLIDGAPEDVALWFSGDARDKCLPKGMSNDDSTGYGTIVGEKWLQGAPGTRGFVLRPHLPIE